MSSRTCGMTETGAGRARRSRRRSRPDAPRRARCRARQWRPRPARRLPDGKHGEPRGAGLRLRHPLRPRAVPPGDPRRLAAGISPRTGCPSATRGSSPGRRWSTTSSIGGRVEPVATPSGRVRSVWHPEETIEAVAYDTPVVGWRGRHVNPLRLWSARAADPLRLELFNQGDHVGALSQQARAEAISKILYPSDSTAGRPRVAPAAGVFLRLGVAAGHRAAPPAVLQRSAVAAGPRRDPAQRHASEHRHRRADAAPGRCLQPAVGRGVADHRRHLLLHQPHAAAGGAGALAGRAVRAGIAAASRDHLPHQRAAPRRRRASAASTTSALRGDLDHRREPRPARAHGPSRLCRLAPGQRRLGAAHQADARDGVRRLAPALSRAHRQQDQRHHLPPLAAPGQSRADPAVVRGLRHARCSTTRRRCRASPNTPTTPACCRRLAAVKRANKTGARAGSCTSRSGCRSTRTRCSTCTSSASTNTSGSC